MVPRQTPILGNPVLVVFLLLLLGTSAMNFGLLISSVVSSEIEAMQLSLATFFPSLLLSGIIWPLEAIPIGLRYISYTLPTTWAASKLPNSSVCSSGACPNSVGTVRLYLFFKKNAAAMRSLLLRGWGLESQDVWIGFVCVLAWNILLFLLATSRIKSRE